MVLPTNKVLSLEQFFLYSSMHVFIPGEQFSTFQEVQRNCSCNIKCPSAFEVACPINMVPFYKGSYCRFRLVVVSDDFLLSVFKETTIENNRNVREKIRKSHSSLISQRFKAHRCEFDMPI